MFPWPQHKWVPQMFLVPYRRLDHLMSSSPDPVPWISRSKLVDRWGVRREFGRGESNDSRSLWCIGTVLVGGHLFLFILTPTSMEQREGLSGQVIVRWRGPQFVPDTIRQSSQNRLPTRGCTFLCSPYSLFKGGLLSLSLSRYTFSFGDPVTIRSNNNTH